MDPSTSRGIGKYAGMAFLLPVSTFVGFGIGYGIDIWCHTVWVRYIFLVLGTVSGLVELIRELSKDT